MAAGVDAKIPVLVIDRLNRPAATWQRIADLVGAGAVTVAGSIPEGESALPGGKFGLIFCSYRFAAEESGTEFISRMRAAGIQTPVIFISEVFDTKGVLEAAAIPMADFLAAPFASEDLKNRIRLLLGNSAANG